MNDIYRDMDDKFFELSGKLKWIVPHRYWQEPYWTYLRAEKDENGDEWDIIQNYATGEVGYSLV